MAKKIIYYISGNAAAGTDENPNLSEPLILTFLDWNESNEKIAMRESYKGKYEIKDDGNPDPSPSQEERIAELEEALDLLLSEATE